MSPTHQPPPHRLCSLRWLRHNHCVAASPTVTPPCLSFPSPPAATAVCYCHRHRLNHPAPPSAAPGAASPTTDRRLLTFRPQLSATTWLPPSADPTPPRPSHTARGHRRLPLHHLNRYAPPSASPHRPLTSDCQPSFPRHLSLPICLPQPPPPLVCVTPVSVPAPACCRLPCRTAALPPATVSTRDNFISNFFF